MAIHSKNKILPLSDALPLINTWKQSGYEVVFTNGCFDILHLGHVTYLEQARGLGDFLILGLNDDASVKRLKGKGRPIKDQDSRAAILAALECVDMVILFSKDTPLELITAIKPDLLVKGGDYTIDQVVGTDVVLAHGGAVSIIDFVDGHSSTALIKKMTDD